MLNLNLKKGNKKMKILTVKEAYEIANTLAETAQLVEETKKAHSIVYSSKLEVAVSMAESDKPEEFDWPLIFTIK